MASKLKKNTKPTHLKSPPAQLHRNTALIALNFKFWSSKNDHSIETLLQSSKEALFLEWLIQLSGFSWAELSSNPREGWGYEFIPRKQFKTTIPSTIPEDVQELMVFRLRGKNGRVIGYRPDGLPYFYIVFVDTTLKAYRH